MQIRLTEDNEKRVIARAKKNNRTPTQEANWHIAQSLHNMDVSEMLMEEGRAATKPRKKK